MIVILDRLRAERWNKAIEAAEELAEQVAELDPEQVPGMAALVVDLQELRTWLLETAR